LVLFPQAFGELQGEVNLGGHSYSFDALSPLSKDTKLGTFASIASTSKKGGLQRAKDGNKYHHIGRWKALKLDTFWNKKVPGI